MHDIADLESRGLPGVLVASGEFEEAAMAQAKAIGCNPPAVYVPHPIQDRTDDEMKALADNAVAAILEAVCREPVVA